MATHSWKLISATLAVVATVIGVGTARATPAHEAIVNGRIEVTWCAAGTPVPLTVAYLQSHLQKSVSRVRGDFDLVQMEDWTA
jgi:hypothetical protein